MGRGGLILNLYKFFVSFIAHTHARGINQAATGFVFKSHVFMYFIH